MNTNILIVDDEEFICIMIQGILEPCGFRVEAAADGLAGWEKIDSHSSKIDLLLLDKNMPGMDGITLLKRIKSDNRFRDLPVIMLTGDDMQEDILEGLAAGANYYLIKPAAEELLKLTINKALQESRLKRELNQLIAQNASHFTLLHQATFRYRTLSEAKELALLLAGISGDPQRTASGYLELLINAVEHGNLAIDYAKKGQLLRCDLWEAEIEKRLAHPDYLARYVEVCIAHLPEAYRVTIVDQGSGFDWRSYVELSPERVFDLHGRGIALSKATSFDSLTYLGNGNCVVATVNKKVFLQIES